MRIIHAEIKNAIGNIVTNFWKFFPHISSYENFDDFLFKHIVNLC